MPSLQHGTALQLGTALARGSGLSALEEAVAAGPDGVTTNYVTALNAARSTVDDFSEDETTELDNFVKSLKGTAHANYPLATDVWDNLRMLALIDPVFGVGEGTTVIPVIADDGSGNPVDPSDASQEDGSMVNGAPWGDWLDSANDYVSLPIPGASFSYIDYTVVAVMNTGVDAGEKTMMSCYVSGEGVTTADTSRFRWFVNGRFDGFGANQRIAPTADISYQNTHLAFARESLTTYSLWKNGEVWRQTNVPASAASTPTEIQLGSEAGGLSADVWPHALAIFDTVLTTPQIASVHDAMDRLRTSQETGGSLLITEGTTDDLLLTAATTDKLLLDA